MEGSRAVRRQQTTPVAQCCASQGAKGQSQGTGRTPERSLRDQLMMSLSWMEICPFSPPPGRTAPFSPFKSKCGDRATLERGS